LYQPVSKKYRNHAFYVRRKVWGLVNGSEDGLRSTLVDLSAKRKRSFYTSSPMKNEGITVEAFLYQVAEKYDLLLKI
jgi:hypothetical protein